MSEPAPDPRSPRLASSASGGPTPAADGVSDTTAPSTAANGAANPANDATAPLLPPPVTFVTDPPQQQRPNVGNMLFLATFWFFMSSNNPAPPMAVVGSDGEVIPRMTTLDRARNRVAEYSYFLNGTLPSSDGDGEGKEHNGTQRAVWADPRTAVQPSAITPARYQHDPSSDFYRNITGFYREATTHVVDLAKTPKIGDEGFWHNVRFPTLNGTEAGDAEGERYNATSAHEKRGDFEWFAVDKWDMQVRERILHEDDFHTLISEDVGDSSWYEEMAAQVAWTDWAWVRGTATLTANSDPATSLTHGPIEKPYSPNNETATTEEDSINYDMIGLHYIPTGTYGLFAMPEGRAIDIRNIPRMFVDRHEAPSSGHASHGALLNASRAIVMRQLREDLKEAEDSLLLSDVSMEEDTRVNCPLLIHLSVPPLPLGLPREQYDAYEDELEHPTGILPSMRRPLAYWQAQPGLAGIAVADGCGIAIGFDRGKGVEMADFWNASVHYATLATAALLCSILLLVRQMEHTRTPSALAKVSVFTIGMPCIMDSWLFSAHLVFGLVSDSKASLPLLIPGFLGLLSAIVFGPRYAVQLWRIQAPERMPPPPPRVQPATMPVAAANGSGDVEAGAVPAAPMPVGPSRFARLRDAFADSPRLTFLLSVVLTWIAFQFILAPSVLPFFLFALYSFWVPQIYRCATRGANSGMDKVYILGTACARLVLPMYILAYPDNVLFVKPVWWIWLLPAWQGIQVLVLLAQERFGPCFFLPASYQPAESYNYHPIFPSLDIENPASDTKASSSAGANVNIQTPDDNTCSICMEHVDTSSASSGLAGEALAGLGLGNLDKRRSYALAPCGHLFHTACLAQWMAVKTICPLCKRPLPPL